MVFLRRLRVWRTPQQAERETGDVIREIALENRDTGACICLNRAVEPVELSELELAERKKSKWVRLKDVYGCLGLLSVPCVIRGVDTSVTFVCVITECKSEGAVPNGEVFHISAVGESSLLHTLTLSVLHV